MVESTFAGEPRTQTSRYTKTRHPKIWRDTVQYSYKNKRLLQCTTIIVSIVVNIVHCDVFVRYFRWQNTIRHICRAERLAPLLVEEDWVSSSSLILVQCSPKEVVMSGAAACFKLWRGPVTSHHCWFYKTQVGWMGERTILLDSTASTKNLNSDFLVEAVESGMGYVLKRQNQEWVMCWQNSTDSTRFFVR